MKYEENSVFRKPTMSAVELAKAMGVGKNAIYEAIKSGRIPNIGIGKTVRIPTSWFLNLLENWRIESDSE